MSLLPSAFRDHDGGDFQTLGAPVRLHEATALKVAQPRVIRQDASGILVELDGKLSFYPPAEERLAANRENHKKQTKPRENVLPRRDILPPDWLPSDLHRPWLEAYVSQKLQQEAQARLKRFQEVGQEQSSPSVSLNEMFKERKRRSMSLEEICDILQPRLGPL